SEQALGVLVNLSGQSASDYQMTVSDGFTRRYRILKPEVREAALKEFADWWDYLPPGEEVEPADGELSEVIENLLIDDFADRESKARALTRVENDLQVATAILLSAGERAAPLLRRLESRVADKLIEGDIQAADLGPAEKAFSEVVGQIDFFDEMIAPEPGLIHAFARTKSGSSAAREYASRVFARVYLRQVDAFARSFTENEQAILKQGQRRTPGQPWPPNLDDTFFASLAAFLFTQSQAPDLIPLPALAKIDKALYSGVGLGVYKTKSPVLEAIKAGDARGLALAAFVEAACLAKDDVDSLRSAFNVALRYRNGDIARELARRVMEPGRKFPDERRRGELLQFAAHSFMSFGKPAEDLELAAQLLDIDLKVRLNGYASKQTRKHIEVREFGVMAIHRMICRDPKALTDGRITGYCPAKRFVKLDIISNPERWEEVRDSIDEMIAEFQQ
ncbi:MAG: hypothetical protein AAF585_12130, partial [Verrucomicrobiota bacterium]